MVGPESFPAQAPIPSRHQAPDWGRLAWAVVAVGALLRLVRFALDSPLWWNEAFLAVNFLRRNFTALLRPLDYGQVAPIGFLWAELAVVETLGFREWTLRLVPLVGGLLALVAFRRLALAAAPGLGGLLAVAILAASYHPIRLAAEVKPYATDLLVAAMLLALAVGWLRQRRNLRPLVALAGLVPLALGVSHPAVFVAGGLTLALALPAWRAGPGARWAWLALGIGTVATFGGIYAVQTGAQSAATLAGMRAYWSDAFPPLDTPSRLPGWLVATHTGRMLAYPGGGDGGGSTATALLVIVGVAALLRRGDRAVLAALLAPFALTLVAAALRRHPYGGHPRVTQHLAPALCLLTGLGLAAIGARLRRPGAAGRFAIACLLALLGIGVVPLLGDVARPYRTTVERDARDFARRFWPEITRDAEVACLRWDLRGAPWESPDFDTALYLANQAISRPAHSRPSDLERVTSDHPLRCVLYHSGREPEPDLGDWLGDMQQRFRLVGQEERPVGTRGWVRVLTFVPGDREAPSSPVAGRPAAVE